MITIAHGNHSGVPAELTIFSKHAYCKEVHEGSMILQAIEMNGHVRRFPRHVGVAYLCEIERIGTDHSSTITEPQLHVGVLNRVSKYETTARVLPHATRHARDNLVDVLRDH